MKEFNKSVHITEDHWEKLKLLALKRRDSVRDVLDGILEEFFKK